MFLSLSSVNDDMSWVISKNPASPCWLKPVRKGVLVGWFSADNTYCVYFKDPPEEMSYSQKDYEYLDNSQFCSPLAYLNALSTAFSSLFKDRHEKDTDEDCRVSLAHVKGSKSYLDRFAKSNAGITYTETSKGAFSITVSTSEGIRYTFHLTLLLCLMMVLGDSNSYLDLNSDVLNKYINSMSIVGIPYLLTSLIKSSLLTNRNKFDKFSSMLEDATLEKRAGGSVELFKGNTLQQRKEWIEQYVDGTKSIIDIGCGEGHYFYLTKRLEDGLFYYPIDIDEDARDAARKAITRKYDNLNILHPLKSFYAWLDGTEGTEDDHLVLLTEVIEHMEFDHAMSLIRDVCSTPNISTVIITYPNQVFNQYYQIPWAEFRHEDHKWEGNSTTVNDVRQVLYHLSLDDPNHIWKVAHSYDIGDRVKRRTVVSTPTIGLVLERCTDNDESEPVEVIVKDL